MTKEYIYVTAVEPLDDYKLLLTFSTGEKKVYNAYRDIIEHPAFKHLINKDEFNKVGVNSDTVEWPEEIDICPDHLYENSVPYV